MWGKMLLGIPSMEQNALDEQGTRPVAARGKEQFPDVVGCEPGSPLKTAQEGREFVHDSLKLLGGI